MLNQSGVTKVTAGVEPQILVFPHQAVTFGIVVDDALGVVDATDGEKYVEAGTPLYGNLDARVTPFTAATETQCVGVLLHRIKVTKGDANGTIIVTGWVNTNRLKTSVKTLLTPAIKTLLSASGVKFIAV